MAFRDLADGADCAVNPLREFSKQIDQERPHHGIPQAAQRDFHRPQQDAMAREFFEASQRGMPSSSGHVGFDMKDLSHTLPQLPNRNKPWSQEFERMPPGHMAMEQQRMFEEAFHSQQHQHQHSHHQQQHLGHQGPDWAKDFELHHQHGGNNQEREMFEKAWGGGGREQEGGWIDEFQQDRAQEWVDEFTEQENWANQFEKSPEQNAEDIANQAETIIETIGHDPKMRNSKFLEFMRQLRDREVGIENNKLVQKIQPASSSSASSWTSEFSSQPDQIPNQQGANAPWAESFHQQQQNQVPGTDQGSLVKWVDQFGENTQARENEFLGQDQVEIDEWTKQFADRFGDQHDHPHELEREYQFEEKNQHLSIDNPFEKALEAIREGKMMEGILLLEATVQQDPNHSQGWYHLGKTQAENEKDQQAISALSKSCSLDPEFLDSWMNLAVSYTNENNRTQAFEALQSWLSHHPKYSRLVPSSPSSSEQNHYHSHASIVDLFLKAANLSPNKLDIQVQTALAILFNISSEYEKAIDCLNACLTQTPDDPLLWNKLGATLANNSNSEEAINAYSKALEINPSFIRARYNFAISCINLGAHQQAAEHLLTALSLQNSPLSDSVAALNQSAGRRQMSACIWQTLRMTLHMLQRSDLTHLCDKEDLDGFQGHFEF
eukprot:Lithocolla_globosa_v1_NODE_706_length_3411_cov_5.489425.p1 type:complete len:665 gc:universal NODE_706_length_3411_cov_5.489425:2131-137(-)